MTSEHRKWIALLLLAGAVSGVNIWRDYEHQLRSELAVTKTLLTEQLEKSKGVLTERILSLETLNSKLDSRIAVMLVQNSFCKFFENTRT